MTVIYIQLIVLVEKIKSMLTNDINPSTIEITITTNTNNSTYDL